MPIDVSKETVFVLSDGKKFLERFFPHEATRQSIYARLKFAIHYGLKRNGQTVKLEQCQLQTGAATSVEAYERFLGLLNQASQTEKPSEKEYVAQRPRR